MPENFRCGFGMRYVAVRSTVFKTGRRRRDALRTGRVISRTSSDLQQVHTLLQILSGAPLAVLTYYVCIIAR